MLESYFCEYVYCSGLNNLLDILDEKRIDYNAECGRF